MTAIRQIPEDALKASLRPVALLRVPLEQLARASGLSFETHQGNLGEQREALLEADDGSQYMLVEFKEGPTRDLELRADERQADPAAAINRVLEALSLPQDAVVWRLGKDDAPPHPSSRLPRDADESGERLEDVVGPDLQQELAAYEVLSSRYTSTTQAQWQVPLLAMTAEAALLAGILATKATSIAAVLSVVSVVIACIAPLATRRIELTAWWDREMLDAYEQRLLPEGWRLYHSLRLFERLRRRSFDLGQTGKLREFQLRLLQWAPPSLVLNLAVIAVSCACVAVAVLR